MEMNARLRSGGKFGNKLDSKRKVGTDGLNTREKQQVQKNRIFSSIKYLSALLCGMVLVLVLMPSHYNIRAYRLPSPPIFEGILEANDILTKSKLLFENNIVGPESLAYNSDGKLFTGTYDGRIVEIDVDGEIQRTVAQFGKPPCGKMKDEHTCGRPLGLRFDGEGKLMVADSYLGLHRVDVKTGKFEMLLSSAEPVLGQKMSFLNDLDLAQDGTIYFTDSSSKWDRRHFPEIVAEGSNDGRLLTFNPATGQVSVALDGLAFPNGVQISHDKKSVLIVELSMCRILRLYIQGPKKGTVDIFADNLPGIPDNIRESKSGGYWVGLAAARKWYTGIDLLSPRPWLKRLIFKFFNPSVIMSLIPKYGMIIELDAKGNILRSFHDPTGKIVPAISEVIEHQDGALIMGSYSLPYLAKLERKDFE